MTDVTPAHVAAELALARDTLAAGEVLAHAGLHRHAVGRAYYAVFHAACALLASIQRPVRTHDGVRALVNEHFVRTGKLAPEHARTLRQTAGDRNDADYDAAATFSEADAREDLDRARAFIDAVAVILDEAAAGAAS